MKKRNLVFMLAMLMWSSVIFAQADAKETVAMIRTNLIQSKEKIKQYAWIETTKTYVKDELKSTQQNQCYYSVDGALTKVATGSTEEGKKPRGIRGKVAGNKKEDMAEYTEKALDKIKAYLPPDGDKLQQIYGAGKVGIQVLEPEKKFKLSFPDYLQQGDVISVSVDKVTQKLITLNISTYVDDPEDKVIFDITYKDLPDGTQYPVSITFIASAKDLKITMDNSGYKKSAQ